MAFSAGFLSGVPAVMLGTVLLTGAVAYSGGVVKVDVEEKKPGGTHIFLPLPANAVSLGLRFVPEKHLNHIPPQARQWMPAVKIAAEELERCPDGPLVLVDTADEKVSIVKRGGSLVIDVDTKQESVHLSFPLSLAISLANQIEEGGPTV